VAGSSFNNRGKHIFANTFTLFICCNGEHTDLKMRSAASKIITPVKQGKTHRFTL